MMTISTARIRAASSVAALTLLMLAMPDLAEAQVGRADGLLEANLASQEQLEALPGVDAALAEAIVDARPYGDMLALDRVVRTRLDDAQRAALYERLFLPINLNTASDEEILLVPGVGDRMLHEFKEYRPYRAMVQFRREIGKYVDDAELAGLERYVFVPIDLNTATDDDILTIPGLGDRMLHEFKEYRPYRSILQFRREIGKYVDDVEVARLERYVTIADGGRD